MVISKIMFDCFTLPLSQCACWRWIMQTSREESFRPNPTQSALSGIISSAILMLLWVFVSTIKHSSTLITLLDNIVIYRQIKQTLIRFLLWNNESHLLLFKEITCMATAVRWTFGSTSSNKALFVFSLESKSSVYSIIFCMSVPSGKRFWNSKNVPCSPCSQQGQAILLYPVI